MKKQLMTGLLLGLVASAFVPNSMRAAEPRLSRKQRAGAVSLLAGAFGVGLLWCWNRASGTDGGIRNARDEGSSSLDGGDGSSARESGETDNEDTFRTERLLSFAYHGPENGAVFAEGPYFSYLVWHKDSAQPVDAEVVEALEEYAATVKPELVGSLDSGSSPNLYDEFANLIGLLTREFADYHFVLVLIDPLAQSVYLWIQRQEVSVIERDSFSTYGPQIKILRGIDRKICTYFHGQVVNAETIVNLAKARQGDDESRYMALIIPPEHLLLRAENGFDFGSM